MSARSSPTVLVADDDRNLADPAGRRVVPQYPVRTVVNGADALSETVDGFDPEDVAAALHAIDRPAESEPSSTNAP